LKHLPDAERRRLNCGFGGLTVVSRQKMDRCLVTVSIMKRVVHCESRVSFLISAGMMRTIRDFYPAQLMEPLTAELLTAGVSAY
jgi:hypothetical protein